MYIKIDKPKDCLGSFYIPLFLILFLYARIFLKQRTRLKKRTKEAEVIGKQYGLR